MRCEVRVLGPVEVIGPRGRAGLQGARQRAVVGVLALHAGAVVARERLVDVLWDENPPRTATKSLHSHLARIRAALNTCGLADVLRTSEPGYLLAIEPEAVDAHRFARSVTTAQQELAAAPGRVAERLREALALWRGAALADAGLVGWGVAEINRWHELRLTAWEYLWDAELRNGRHHAAIAELERLLVTYPTRERLVALYMLALYRCGRQVDALDAYQRLRIRLADELGVDPGSEVAALHTDILRRSPDLDSPHAAPNSTTPAQLPAVVGHFTGRGAELAALDAALDERGDRPIVVVSGPGGMGKTALAVQWAHRVADRFPDGQLFLDLHGHDPDSALTAADALSYLLVGLGLPDDRIPAVTVERASLYRSLLHGKRILILLDNCGATEDVLTLVPGNAAGLLLITSRNTPAPLMVRHAVRAVALDALGHGAAVALLASVLGPARIERERVAAARLAKLCGGMPLALRIAAAKLAVSPDRPIRQLADELAGPDRLEWLAVPGDSRTVRAVFASAYRALSAPAGRAFRLLGMHPGPSFGVELVATVCDVPLALARALVAELAGTHLIAEAGAGRYAFHDLIRMFAHECGLHDEPAADRTEAVTRLVDWYLALARTANQILDRAPNRVRPQPRYRVELPRLPDQHAVLAFLDTERHNMVPVVRFAGEHDLHAAAWHLTSALTSFFDARGHWTERIEMCRLGLAAARALGDPAAEGEMLRSLGTAYRLTRRMTEALDCYPRALELMRAADDRRGEAAVYNNVGGASVELRRFDDAVAAYRQALALHTAAGNRWGMAVAQRNLGYTYVRMGQPERSFEPLRSALANARDSADPRLEAATLDTLGEAFLHQGEHSQALAHFRQALTIGRRAGDRRFESETLNNIGAAQLELDDPEAALVSLRQALAVSRELADPHGESLARANIGRALAATGDLAGAREELLRALTIRERVPDRYEEARLRNELAEVAARSGLTARS